MIRFAPPSMRRKPVQALIAVLTVGLITVGVVLPLAAQEAPPPIATEILTPRSVFTDDIDLKFKIKRDGDRTVVVNVEDPSRTVTGRFTVQPGAQFPWHTHAGPVVVNIVQGSLVYVPAEDCSETEYPAGTAFVDPGHGHVHSAFNPQTEGETVFVATFFEAPAEGPLLIPAEAPEGCLV
jgi:quercetin dioxygenase-like cupin family protein